ncbi:MAG: tetraacyldisaccharide 4'-kinase [Steroidobacteraceae bacterium]|nr:tetraacyldisaccharide 4'-kinase [Deltaproteobacteria bacterium]
MTDSFSAYWRDLANGNRTSARDRLLILCLMPFSLTYSFIQRLRAIFYRIGMLRSRRLPRPVVSIGNITVGGTGKTPVTAHIARWLLQRGYRVVVLSRGYGGSLEGQTVVVSDGATIMMSPRECGDEPFLLASTVPGVMVVIGSDRYAAGLLAIQQLAPDLFLLDDGFQHLRLQRDLNILLMDHRHPYGNGWTLPAGLLREPLRAVQRADLIIHTRCPQDAPAVALAGNIPSCNARHRIIDLLPLSGGNPTPLPSPDTRKVLAFAGIAEPTLFFDELRSLGLDLVHTLRFPDHTTYAEAEVTAILDAMNQYGAEVAITTEKDGVKLKGLADDIGGRILLAHLELVIDEPAPLLNSLRNLLQIKP